MKTRVGHAAYWNLFTSVKIHIIPYVEIADIAGYTLLNPLFINDARAYAYVCELQ